MYKKIRSRDDHDFLPTLKSLPTFKDKVGYIWSYYNIHIIITVAVIAMAISIGTAIYHNSAPVYVNGFGINVYTNKNAEEYDENYQEQAILRDYLGIPENDRTKIEFYSDLGLVYDKETEQTDMEGGRTLTFLDMRFSAQEIDYLLFTPEVAEVLIIRSDGLQPLSNILTEEEMEQYKDRLHYSSAGVAVGMDISDSEMIRKMGLTATEPICLGFSSYPDNPDHLRPFFEFIEQTLPQN